MCQQQKRLVLLALFSTLHVLSSASSEGSKASSEGPKASSVGPKSPFRPDLAPTRVRREGKYDSDPGAKSPRSGTSSEEGSIPATLGKRCISCDSGYDRRPYYRDGYEEYDRYDDRYSDRDKYFDRDRYDRYSDRSRGRYGGLGGVDRYGSQDRYHGGQDRYGGSSRYGIQDRYGGLDGYGEADRYGDRYRDRYGDRGRDRYNDYDRYDPYERYDKYDRFADRGVGYDNRGYDYRGSESGGYRPWDETYRGTSGFDNAGRGYYFATGRPDYGSGSGGGYASGWNYGNSGGGRDDYYRDRGHGGYATYRPYRDPYDGYRVTSYLYGRPSSTTIKTPTAGEDTNTPPPQENSG